jgi:uncharacterized protein (TIGR00725 family)
MVDIKDRVHIAVVGAGDCSAQGAALACDVGRELARRNAVLFCGGLGGVMEMAAKGAREAGGLTVGFLPGFEFCEANPYIDIAVPTGLSHGRNILVVRAAMAVIAVEGSYGTLSEIALALALGKPVIGLNTWDVGPEVIRANSAQEAVEQALLRAVAG